MLVGTAKVLVADDKGLLAMDESIPTCNKRFAKLGIPQTVEARRAYRELIVTTPGLGECISGAILYDETIRQQKKDGTPFIKVIDGCRNHSRHQSRPGRQGPGRSSRREITEGLDGLRDRLAEYAQMGARFAKWRAVIAMAMAFPAAVASRLTHKLWLATPPCVRKPDWSLSSSRKCSWTGSIRLERCREVTEEVLRTVFNQLYTQRVMLEGMILKPNMVLPGLASPKQESVEDVADATVSCLLRTVPAAVPGVAFLSGGQSAELASARLNAMNIRFKSRLPWALRFRFPGYSAAGARDLER